MAIDLVKVSSPVLVLTPACPPTNTRHGLARSRIHALDTPARTWPRFAEFVQGRSDRDVLHRRQSVPGDHAWASYRRHRGRLRRRGHMGPGRVGQRRLPEADLVVVHGGALLRALDGPELHRAAARCGPTVDGGWRYGEEQEGSEHAHATRLNSSWNVNGNMNGEPKNPMQRTAHRTARRAPRTAHRAPCTTTPLHHHTIASA